MQSYLGSWNCIDWENSEKQQLMMNAERWGGQSDGVEAAGGHLSWRDSAGHYVDRRAWATPGSSLNGITGCPAGVFLHHEQWRAPGSDLIDDGLTGRSWRTIWTEGQVRGGDITAGEWRVRDVHHFTYYSKKQIIWHLPFRISADCSKTHSENTTGQSLMETGYMNQRDDKVW